jgi:hypothetical protein
MIATQNKYMIVGNGRIPVFNMLFDIENVKKDYIEIQLPDWFRSYKGKKIIKIYGTQLYQIFGNKTTQGDYQFDNETPLESTLHSNIVGSTNTGILIDPYPNLPDADGPNIKDQWIPQGPFSGGINDIYDQYVLTANNFYTPKTYEYTEGIDKNGTLRFWFKNKYGVTIPIFYVCHVDETVFYSSFLLFKIEMELLTL